MSRCGCEDFPCCDCGQEYLAELRYEASVDYERDAYHDRVDWYDALDIGFLRPNDEEM